MHRRIPPAVPRRAAPPPVGRLECEQPRARALGRDLRTLRRDLVRGRVGEVAQDLPADRRIGVEQPADDRAIGHAIATRLVYGNDFLAPILVPFGTTALAATVTLAPKRHNTPDLRVWSNNGTSANGCVISDHHAGANHDVFSQ